MQNTRLNSLVSTTATRLSSWIQNPWRRSSVLVISLLGGNFLASAVSTIAGQRSWFDPWIAALLVLGAEAISAVAYCWDRREPRSLLLQAMNALKIGFIYGMFLDALKLGS